MKLEDKVIIVTGGAGLIGKSFCKKILAEGGVPIIADISEENAQKVRVELGGGEVAIVDITAKTSVKSLLEDTFKKHGRIDALVNNAYPRNKNYGKHFFDVELEDFNENIGLNLGGYFLTSQTYASFLIDKKLAGSIVNISSIYGVIAPKFEVYDNTKMTMPVEYSVIKSGLLHLTKYMAKYLKGKNIRVNAISPGGVFDNQNATFVEKYNSFCVNKGMISPEDLGGALTFLLSNESEFVNGQNIVVDDGFTL